MGSEQDSGAGRDLRVILLQPAAGSAHTQPAWSPGGKRIVFASGRGVDEEIYAMKAGPEGRTNRPKNEVTDYEPAWQPLVN